MADRKGVKGLARLKRQIAALPNSVRVAVADALEKGAAEVADAVERAAPERYGALKRSVGWCVGDPPKTSATGALRASSAEGSAGEALSEAGLKVSVYAGDDEAFYARWVEFGTAAGAAGTHKDAGGKTRTREVAHHATPAQPFFYPTIRALKKRAKGRVVRAGNKAAKALAALK